MKRPLALVLLVLLPWVVPVANVALHQPPEGISLRGTWAWRTPAGERGTIELPAVFRRAKVLSNEVTLERSIELETTPSEPWVLILGDVRYAAMKATINGHFIGSIGDWASRQNGDFQMLEQLHIPPGVLHAGTNSIVFELATRLPAFQGIVDTRLVMAPSSKIELWFIRTSRAETFLRSAPLLVSILLLFLLGVLATVPGPVETRRLTWRGVGLVASSALFVLSVTGLGIVGVIPVPVRQWLSMVAVIGSLTSLHEFILDYFHAWAPRWVWANRIWAGVTALAQLAGSPTPYLLFNAWSLVVATRSAVVMVTRLRGRSGLLPWMLASGMFSLIVTGVGDVLTNIGVWQVPRMWGLALSNVQIPIGILVLNIFIELGETNRQLTRSLAKSNDELTVALVEARTATRMKSEFLAKVSHELRTPLNAIINIPEGLLEDFEPKPPDGLSFTGDAHRAAKHLKTLHSSGLHLLGIVDQVLDFSKAERGGLSLDVGDISVERLLREVTAAVESQARQRKVTLESVGEQALIFRGDYAKVMQALQAVVSNAVKFSPEKSTVTVRASHDDSMVRFDVDDRGIGIAPENQALIFEGFRQVEGGSTRRFGGTGLGLAIARRMVELHGGTISLVSTVGQGSTFSIVLPRAPKAD